MEIFKDKAMTLSNEQIDEDLDNLLRDAANQVAKVYQSLNPDFDDMREWSLFRYDAVDSFALHLYSEMMKMLEDHNSHDH